MGDRNRFHLVAALSLAPLITLCAQGAPDYSKESATIETIATKVSFDAGGTREWEQKVAIRILSEAAVRQYGILAFGYASGNERLTVEYVRVKNPDGSVVATPDSDIADMATSLATTAPT